MKKQFWVIPEIEEVGDGYAVLNSHILVVDSFNGAIKSSFYKQKAWYTDALRINSIKISYQPYQLNPTYPSKGIKFDYEGSSRVFPIGIEELSLFVRNGEQIKLLLENFAIHRFNGETGGMTNGQFEIHQKNY